MHYKFYPLINQRVLNTAHALTQLTRPLVHSKVCARKGYQSHNNDSMLFNLSLLRVNQLQCQALLSKISQNFSKLFFQIVKLVCQSTSELSRIYQRCQSLWSKFSEILKHFLEKHTFLLFCTGQNFLKSRNFLQNFLKSGNFLKTGGISDLCRSDIISNDKYNRSTYNNCIASQRYIEVKRGWSNAAFRLACRSPL